MKQIDKIDKSTESTILKVMKTLFFLFPFCYGLFYEWSSCVAGVLFSGILLWMAVSGRTLKIPWGAGFWLLFGIVILYLVSMVYAVDWGMAFLGFIKFFPLIIFSVIAAQFQNNQRIDILRMLPWSACAMTFLSICFYFTPLKQYFYRAERLGGFFQYSNTFALVLFLGIMILLFYEEMTKIRLFMTALLTMGILMTGSRSIFLLAIVVFFTAGVKTLVRKRKNQENQQKDISRIMAAVTVLIVFSFSGILAVCTGNTQLFSRFASISLTSSTFLGRLLYYQDAVAMIFRHPLGLGYMGYRYLCGSEQTGVYQIQYVHNDFLQAGLDIGMMGMVFCFLLFLVQIFSKHISSLQKILWLIIVAHACVDFDLQFLFVDFILILCMDFHKVKYMERRQKTIIPAAILCMCMFLYMMIPLVQEHFGYHREACEAYPYYTEARVNEMLQEKDEIVQNNMAEQIIKQNPYCSDAYYVRAIFDVNHKNYDSMVKNQKRLIELEKYHMDNYQQYIKMLSVALGEMIEEGEKEKGKEYIRCVLEVPEMLGKLRERTSELAYRIKDKPELEMEDAYEEYIKRLENLGE